MKKLAIFLLCALVAAGNIFGQSDLPVIESPVAVNSSGYSGTGSNYDVKYHKMWFRINPDSNVYVMGNVKTKFLTTQNNVRTITFDLNNVFTVDSVYYQLAKLPSGNITKAGNILSIDLGTTLPINTLDSVTIYYQGVPPYLGGGYPEGFKKFNFAGYNYIMSVSESYEDRDWWPCKADMQDKVDSMEINLNVPWAYPAAADTFWGIANGRLVDSAIVGNSRTFTYKTNYPIASYLVGVSVGRFNHYYRGAVNINGTNVPVIYNLLIGRSAGSYTTNVANLDKMNLVLSAYSQKFGDYPFKDDKHGYYDGLVGAGGIEHQTSSCIATSSLDNLPTLAHELMHQWFGDNVSFSTWNDLWLAEGFAQYSEALVGELVPSLGISAYGTRNGIKSAALNDSTHSAWIPDSYASSSPGIWGSNYGNTIYKRGAMVASMLRTICGDAKYFQALTNYQTNRGLKSATADTLKNYFNAVLGTDISEFFKDYAGGSGNGAVPVGGEGNPKYVINWNNPSTNKLAVSIASQAQTIGSNVSYFNGPVVLHVKGSTLAQDTTIVFFDWGGGDLSPAGNGLSAPVSGNLLVYNLSFDPVTVSYDDSARTLSTGSTAKLSILAVRELNFNARKTSNGNEINLSVINGQQNEKVILLKSFDGINFTEAGEMIAERTTGQTNNFYFIDGKSYSATVFYKAKIISAESSEFTKILKIFSQKNASITIAPNPACKKVNVSFTNINREKTTINILNAAGMAAMKFSTNNDYMHFDASNLANGVYEIQLIQNNEIIESKKLIIQH